MHAMSRIFYIEALSRNAVHWSLTIDELQNDCLGLSQGGLCS